MGSSSKSRDPARARPIVPLLDYQREDVESTERFRWNCWARQTGKSFTKSLRRILRGLNRRRTQVFLSAGERQCRELMMKARQHCEALKIATDFYDARFFKDLSIKQLEIVLPGRVRIIGLPANPQTARGYTGDVFLDEFAMHAFDREIWAAMFPTLLRGGGELDVASTPRGCGNMFHALRENDLFSTSVVTLPDAIAQGLQADAQAMRDAMGDDELYRQEFLCEFLDEATAFLTYEQIARCVDTSLTLYDAPTYLSAESRDLFVGVDVGRRRDLTVVWVLARDGDVLSTVAIFELSGAPFRVQFDLLSELMSIRNVRRCCIDAGGLGMQLAEQTVERFGGHRVEPVTFTPPLKSQLAVGLRIAVETARIRIPQDERIVRDWHSLERTMTEAGHFRLAAPRREGSHADRFWAAALALHAATAAAAGISECQTVAPIEFARKGTW
jgi:phage FluMu gp28-like protein